MAAFLNLDILFEIISHADAFGGADRHKILSNLALASQDINNVIRSMLFREVKWPHGERHDEESGLHFFPEALWPYFRDFHLDWPDHWPDQYPPLWGTKPLGRGIYHPEHLDKLERALPKMPHIHTFEINCPFYPPTSLLNAIVRCPNIKDFRIIDTPLAGLLPSLPDTFRLERMTLVPVGEAIRVGEGPFNKKHHDLTYYTSGYRKQHMGRSNLEFDGHQYLLQICRPQCLKYLQLSSKYLALDLLVSVSWPELETLVLTGPRPRAHWVPLVMVIERMPKLFDLRILFSRTNRKDDEELAMIDPTNSSNANAFARIKYLALSNAFATQDILRHSSSLERLSVSAVIAHPRIPIALSRREMMKILKDLAFGGGNVNLKRIRLMTEDALDFALFREIGRVCPSLEFVEVELCGYREGEAGFEWTDYGDVFSSYAHLEELRIGIPFAGCEEPCGDDPKECIRSDRRDCAIYFASCVPTLRRIGFEYRMRTGSHRHEDRWLDYEVIRLTDGGIRLSEMGQTWYPLPEVWNTSPLYE